MHRIYLRLSVTDRCNLRCTYCRPDDAAVESSPPLGDDELLELVSRIHSIAPIDKIRLTGGEPLCRPGLTGLVQRLRRKLPAAQLCLTTNGTLLERHAGPLRRAGISAVNISLDAAEPVAFAAATGRDKLAAVQAGLQAAVRAGFERLKLNTVLLRSINGDQLLELCGLAADHGASPRFIELMPIGPAARRFERDYLPADEALTRLTLHLPEVGAPWREGTARLHRLRDGDRLLTVGFITAISHPFCSNCNRVRLDAGGRLITCLRFSGGTDLAALLRAGRHAELDRQIEAAVLAKSPRSSWPDRSMVAVGG